jgi:transporter family-2 protein
MLSLRFALWAAAAGALIPVMAVLNARLGRTMGEPMHAPVVLFLAGLLFCIATALVTTGSLPVPSSVRSASFLDLAGGLIVGFYVISATLLAPRLGLGNFILLAMVAQIILSALIDHFGWLGVVQRPINLLRAGGIVLLLLGLSITQLAQSKPTS